MALNNDSGFDNGKFIPFPLPKQVDPNISAGGYQQRQLADQQYKNQAGLNQQGFGFQRDLSAQQQAADMARAQLAASTQVQGFGSQEKIAAGNQASQQAVAQTQAEAAKYPYLLKDQHFQSLFPYLTNALSGKSDVFNGYGGNGQVGTAPQINAGPVLSNPQIQQQVNAQRAANDQKTAGAIRTQQQQMGGRGYGSRSPLAMELGQGLLAGNLATNTANERDTRINAAQLNAQHLLSGQKAQEEQFANRQGEDIQRGQLRQGYLSSLLGLMGSFG